MRNGVLSFTSLENVFEEIELRVLIWREQRREVITTGDLKVPS